jgi:hypothetical protein
VEVEEVAEGDHPLALEDEGVVGGGEAVFVELLGVVGVPPAAVQERFELFERAAWGQEPGERPGGVALAFDLAGGNGVLFEILGTTVVGVEALALVIEAVEEEVVVVDVERERVGSECAAQAVGEVGDARGAVVGAVGFDDADPVAVERRDEVAELGPRGGEALQRRKGPSTETGRTPSEVKSASASVWSSALSRRSRGTSRRWRTEEKSPMVSSLRRKTHGRRSVGADDAVGELVQHQCMRSIAHFTFALNPAL